jgi:hypothetical protein
MVSWERGKGVFRKGECMGRFIIGLCCLVGLVLGFVCNAYAGDSDTQQSGLFAAVGLNNLFQTQAASGKKPEEKALDKPELSWGGFSQFMFRYDDNAPETFDVTRMRFKVTGSYDFLSFFVQADTESTSGILLDYWANISCPNYKKEFNLRAGRFTVPFGWQTPISPYELLTINYSQIVSRLFGTAQPFDLISGTPPTIVPPAKDWDNLRDQGFYIHGVCEPKFKFGREFKPTIGYAAGILNGESRAAEDSNDDKASIFRVYVTPNITPKVGATLGFSYYDGSRFYATDPLEKPDPADPTKSIPVAANGREFSRRMHGIDWRFEFFGRLLIQGEFIHGEVNASEYGKHETAPSIPHHKANYIDGWFVEIGYNLTEVSEKLQLVGKVDVMDLPLHTWDSSVSPPLWRPTSDTNRRRTYGLGANYYINKFSKLQVIWEHKDDEGCLDTAGQNDKIFAVLGVSF